ncbi:hypothetical protein HanRHA438_Chr16g0740881 [Helianthus annuus]|nr:hypothetical protein HanRHA438_Chr16g0740881 [Helianthus annuus]
MLRSLTLTYLVFTVKYYQVDPTKNVLNICKPLHVMFFNPNLFSFDHSATALS